MAAYTSTLEPFVRADAAARARRVRMILLDADGILTDGSIIYPGPDGEPKHFSALDSIGLRFAMLAGLRIGIVSGRKSDALARRAGELGIDDLYQACLWKLDAYDRIRKRRKLADADVAFLGDDLLDLPVMKRVGFAGTVPGAVPEVTRSAHFVSSRPGGRGGVREIIDFILKVQGRWSRIAERYL